MGNPPASLLMVTILSISVQIDNVADSGRVGCRRYGGHMSTEITVRGSFSAFERPERGTVHATIAYEGPVMEPVYGRLPVTSMPSKRRLPRWTTRTTAPSRGGPLTNCAPGRTGHGTKTASSFRSCTTPASGRSEVSGLQRSVPLGRRARREHRGIPGCTRRVGAHRETAGSTREGSAHTGRPRRRHPCAGSTPTRSGLARFGPSPSPMPGCSVRDPESGPSAAYMRAAAVGGAPDVELVPEHIEVSAEVDARFVVGTASTDPA